jgi:HPt (histidine-containing phosphotransfer) domain-containing protein
VNDLIARFLPRFAALARERTARAMAVATNADVAQAPSVVRDMHSVAGEAGMLGLQAVLEAAREAENAAKRFSTAPDRVEALAGALRSLDAAVSEATKDIA